MEKEETIASFLSSSVPDASSYVVARNSILSKELSSNMQHNCGVQPPMIIREILNCIFEA